MKWYDKYDEPIADKPVLIQTLNGNFMIVGHPLKQWKWVLRKHKLKYWIFCDEIKQVNQ